VLHIVLLYPFSQSYFLDLVGLYCAYIMYLNVGNYKHSLLIKIDIYITHVKKDYCGSVKLTTTATKILLSMDSQINNTVKYWPWR